MKNKHSSRNECFTDSTDFKIVSHHIYHYIRAIYNIKHSIKEATK